MKRVRPKGPPVPSERHGTVRQEIFASIEDRVLSAREISIEVRIPEKEVYGHLEHLQRSLSRGDEHLVVTPAECMKCGFVFRKRDRLSKPGKCPVCKGEQIRDPLFTVREREKTHHSDPD